MKHIKRKVLQATKIGPELKELFNSTKPEPEFRERLRKEGTDKFIGWLQTDNDQLIQAFGYEGAEGGFMIPEPHPVVLYFNAAQSYMKHVENYKASFFAELKTDKPSAQKQLDAFYNHFSVITMYTTFLYNALEAFMNYIIPYDFKYEQIKKGKVEILNKENIQRYIQFEDKIKEVIPAAMGKDFHMQYSAQFDILKKLKKFRDEIVHTKAYSQNNNNPYKALFSLSLKFDYNKAIVVVREYINYYEPNLIEDCNCGLEH